MTTFITFSPPPNAPFQTNITLDGTLYTLLVNWNLFGQRWYVNLFNQTNTRILTLPLIGSQTAFSINSITWDPIKQVTTVVTAVAHSIPIGTVAKVTISGLVPTAYLGLWVMEAKDAYTLTFPLTIDPGSNATATGLAAQNINLIEGYGFTSTLVYREENATFEVTP